MFNTIIDHIFKKTLEYIDAQMPQNDVLHEKNFAQTFCMNSSAILTFIFVKTINTQTQRKQVAIYKI